MKTPTILSLAFAALTSGLVGSEKQPVELASDEGVLHIPATIIKDKDIPQFYAVKIDNQVDVYSDVFHQTAKLNFTKLQGKALKFSVELNQVVKTLTVESPAIKHWALRTDQKSNKQYLDIYPTDDKVEKLQVVVKYSQDRSEKDLIFFDVLSFLPLAKESGGFSETITVNNNTKLALSAVEEQGFFPVELANDIKMSRFITHTGGKLKLKAEPSQILVGRDYCDNLSVVASVAADGKSAELRVKGEFVSFQKEGGSQVIMSGDVALTEYPKTEGLKAIDHYKKNVHSVSLSVSKRGRYPFDLNFVVPIREVSGWKQMKFELFNGAIVPIRFSGLKNAVKGDEFIIDEKRNVVPKLAQKEQAEPSHLGFLPAEGGCDLQWKAKTKQVDSKLFFTTDSVVNVTVGGGLVRQSHIIQGKILQGKLDKYVFKMVGEGDVTGVRGKHVSNWVVNDKNELVVTLTGAYEKVESLVVYTQQPLGVFPAKVNPIKLTPVNAERHTGYLRVVNQGAVNVQVTKVSGMMQVTPQQFPYHSSNDKFDQVYAYRFPSKERSWEIQASQILPEISVRHLLVYGVGLSDRSLSAEINLDVREAPLREWTVMVPDGYAVSNVLGNEVSDYVLSNQVSKGMRALKVLFKSPLKGVYLIGINLEKNLPAAEGVWKLPQIEYPGVEDVRGQIGVSSALGWRVQTGSLDQLTEIPLAFFQKKSASIQQAYRQRKKDWSAEVKIEKLNQSIQADMFHLYTVRESIIECGVFINYFVVGAPTTTWRVELPETAENVTVVGQNVRSHFRSGKFLTVNLEQPALGNVNLFVKYEEPLKAQGGVVSLGQVTPLGVQSESGYIQVISPLQVDHSVEKASKSLLQLEVTELPAEYRVLSSVPTVAAWQYSARPFDLSIKINWFAASEYVTQSVDYATVKTSLTKLGRAKTEAVFFVKSRGKQNLRMKLPEGAELWEVSANGGEIIVRKDGSDYLIPLPAQLDINTPVVLEVSYGSQAGKDGKSRLGVPVLSAPTVVANWKVKSEDNEHVVPIGGNVSGNLPFRGETGFSWVGNNLKYLLGVLAFIAAGGFMFGLKKQALWKKLLAVMWLLLGGAAALMYADSARSSMGTLDTSFEVVAPMVSADTEVYMEVQQFSQVGALVSPLGVFFVLLGLAAFVSPYIMKSLKIYKTPVVGTVLLSIGLLMQYGGAVPFFGMLALLAIIVLLYNILPLLKNLGKPAAAAASILIAMMAGVQDADAGLNTIKETWEIKGERLYGSATFELDAEHGDKMPILYSPATLTKFESETCMTTRDSQNNKAIWHAVALKKGKHTVKIEFEMRVPKLAESAWPMVTANTPVREMTVRLDRKGWETTSAAAVRVQHRQAGGKSVSVLTLLPCNIQLAIKPSKVDPDSIPVKFFTETSDLYIPAPGVLDGVHNIQVKPISGQLRSVELSIPKGLMIGDVKGAQVNSWKFDPSARTLSVQLTEPMKNSFMMEVQTQQALAPFPEKVNLQPLRVKDASKVIGMLGLGFGNEAQPDGIKVTGMNIANLDDFSRTLQQAAMKMAPAFTIHKAYRYNKQAASLTVDVDDVSPELRMQAYQNLYVGEDRLVMNNEIEINITRAGVFQVEFLVPKGFEVESVTGPSLRDFSELLDEKGQNQLTLQFQGKQKGKQRLRIALVNNKPIFDEEWEVPKLMLKNALRQSATLTVLPQQGIQIEPVSRKNATQEDAREVRKNHPGALIFRLLQKDSELKLKLSKLEAWVTAQALHEVTLREGQVRTRVGLLYQISHAAIKEVHVRIPHLNEAAEGTVRVSGMQVKGIEKIDGELWAVKLRRGMIGNLKFDLEFQVNPKQDDGFSLISPVLLEDVKQLRYYVSVRASERLDISPVDTTKAWRPTEWKLINEELYHLTNSGVPELSYQLMDSNSSLKVEIKRHAMAETLKLRVEEAVIQTLFSRNGAALNHVVLKVYVVEKGAMKVTLPKDSDLFGVQVSGDSVPVVSEGDAIRFNVAPGLDGSTVTIQLVYSNARQSGSLKEKVMLRAPEFDVPLEQLNWHVILPKGVELKDVGGDFEKAVREVAHNEFDTEEYMQTVRDNREVQVQRAAGMMQQVHEFMKSGKEREKANEILNQVYRNKAVGRDMNEDAHDLLVKNQWQHALMGLNTRRQKMYLDNKAEGNTPSSNQALEEAAGRNPLFRGRFDYDPNQVRDYMQGMDEDERMALEQMARLLVSADIHAVSAPQAMNVTVPEMGTVLEFERKIHLGDAKALVLELTLANKSEKGKGMAALIVALIALAGCFVFWKK